MRRNRRSISTDRPASMENPQIRSGSPGSNGGDRLPFWPHTEEAQMFHLRLRYSDVGFSQVARDVAGLALLGVLVELIAALATARTCQVTLSGKRHCYQGL